MLACPVRATRSRDSEESECRSVHNKQESALFVCTIVLCSSLLRLTCMCVYYFLRACNASEILLLQNLISILNVAQS